MTHVMQIQPLIIISWDLISIICWKWKFDCLLTVDYDLRFEQGC